MSPLDIVAASVGVAWFAYSALSAALISLVDRLPRLDGDDRPTVAVVITARNERERIRETALRFAAQRGVSLRVLIVDDRSDDGTGEVVARLADEHPVIEQRRIDSLPAGWLGKNHACRVGADWAGQTEARWLLFTDADAWCAPTMVERAVRAAEASRADHLCVVPGERHTTIAARSSLLSFAVAGLAAGGLANRDRYRGPIGVGAFNLVRATAYRAVGGHERIPLEVLDDAGLGELLLRAGFRSRVFAARESVEISWARTLPGIFRALEKNLFAAFGYRTWVVLPFVTAGVGAWLAALVLGVGGLVEAIAATKSVSMPEALRGGWPALLAGAGLLSFSLPAWLAARRTGAGLVAALAAPLLWPMPLLALARSAWVTVRGGGVRWRDTHYPLELLRRARRERSEAPHRTR